MLRYRRVSAEMKNTDKRCEQKPNTTHGRENNTKCGVCYSNTGYHNTLFESSQVDACYSADLSSIGVSLQYSLLSGRSFQFLKLPPL